MSHRRLGLSLSLAIMLVLAACSVADSTTTAVAGSPMPMPSEDDQAEDGFAWGEPAEAVEADRVVEIEMRDSLEFVPANVEVTVGETVTFRVTNAGQLLHDFTLGDEETQAQHEAEMAEGMGTGHAEPNVLTLEAGQSGELTWHFTAPVTIEYGCHVPGHHDAGMLGTLTIHQP